MKPALLKLHAAVFLWGFTGVLGRLIHLNEGLLVWYRLSITIITLFLLMWKQQKLEKPPVKTVAKLFAVGCIVALHWVFFYGSIKAANVSIALTCLSSAGLFTALIEPFITKTPINITEIALGLLGVLGICLIFHFDARFHSGILIGVVATILSVLFSIFNKKLVRTIKPKTMMLYELIGGWLMCTLLLPFYLTVFPTTYLFPSLTDVIWLVLLSWFCTVLAMELSLQALKKVSVFTQNLSLNLEPVYGIGLAFIIYHEEKGLSDSFYIGFGLIILSVGLQMLRTVFIKSQVIGSQQ
ncbi:DMT family transporter [Parasediminibacterium sp. JCM 36343]|uniref:DMT family transporter n=1 Tax=Parasediminibacterium sp. JCM 36343 TaxID=3374279 RepID=UPI00397CA9E1